MVVGAGDACPSGSLTYSLRGFGKGARRQLSLQVWMWAGAAKEQSLVGTFDAGPKGKKWAILRHPFELCDVRQERWQTCHAGNGRLCLCHEEGQLVPCSSKQGRIVVRGLGRHPGTGRGNGIWC